ncbi:MAG: 2-phosphosulfolactate phosphatase [Candidatus Latescibacteria bacterium]|nr:2-phosphosulfolactate phosphatase [Candidatus Latescibacterota bacterium]
MEIRLLSLLDGARQARGTAVVIDVYRAFTTAAVAFRRGVDKIVLVAEVEEALDLKERGVGQLCMGEVDGKKPAGFDLGNSPYELSQTEVAGKTLIQSTRAGTVGVAAAEGAERIFLGSLVLARATVAAIRAANPPLVSIVAMGWAAEMRTDEDEQCGLYIRNLLEERAPDPEAVKSLVLAGGESAKFDDPAKPHFHPGDRDLALEIDTADFALEVKREDGLLVARRCQY